MDYLYNYNKINHLLWKIIQQMGSIISNQTNQVCHFCQDLQIKPDEIHCKLCHTSFSKTDNHCYTCCATYTTQHNTNHCCSCNLKHKILITYNPSTESHCCNCQKVFDESTDKSHCKKCCFETSSLNIGHCCKCKMTYDLSKEKHCDCCCKNYNIYTESHCGYCHKIFNTLTEKHCCKCKNTYNYITESHCDKCCKTTPNNEQKHSCKKNINDLIERINDYMKANHSGKVYAISPCFLNKCQSVKKFCQTVGGDSQRYFFAYHGSSHDNISSICCDGWDISKRNKKHGQVYGAGEYFANYLSSSEGYADQHKYVILTMLVNLTDSIKTADRANGEKYYIVSNTDTHTYNMPVAIIENNSSIDKFCVCPKNSNMIFSVLKIQYLDDNNTFTDYSEDLMNKVKLCQGSYIFELSDSRYTYKINLCKQTQTNTSTNKSRPLKITFH